MANKNKDRLSRAIEVYGSGATLVEAVTKQPVAHLDEDLKTGETIHVPVEVRDAYKAQGIV